VSPEYDAFGRPVEPPIEKDRRPQPHPAASAERVAQPTAAPAITRRRSPVVPVLVALVVVVGAVALGVLSASDDRPRARLGGDLEATGLTPRSTVERVRALRAAIRPGERLLSVSVGTSYASLRLRRPAGSDSTTRTVSLRDDGDVSSFDGSSSIASGPGADPRRLDVEAPGRLVGAVLRGIGPGAAAKVSSVSVSAYEREDEPRLDWSAFVRGGAEPGRSWRGDEHGRHVVRVIDGAPAPDVGERGPAVPPTGTSGRSLLASANLRAAIGAAVGRDTAARVATLEVRPERVQVGLMTPGEPRRYVTVNAALGVDTPVLLTRSGPTVRAAQIVPAAPVRALDRIGRRLRIDARARAAFALLQVPDPNLGGGPLRWLVVLDDTVPATDRTWQATADGRRVARSGEPLRP
jgi:hypothetical protein